MVICCCYCLMVMFCFDGYMCRSFDVYICFDGYLLLNDGYLLLLLSDFAK